MTPRRNSIFCRMAKSSRLSRGNGSRFLKRHNPQALISTRTKSLRCSSAEATKHSNRFNPKNSIKGSEGGLWFALLLPRYLTIPHIKTDPRKQLRQCQCCFLFFFEVAQTKASLWSRGVARWFRWGLSVADPFVSRCLTSSAMLPFPHPAHRTGRADLPHPALGEDSHNRRSHCM